MASSYASGASTTPLLGETIGANLERTAATFGDREALVSVHQGLRLTYAELDAAVDALASGLLGLGVEKGDRVGIWSPNRVEWVLTQYATAKVGAILVNVNPAYRTSELEFVLNQSGCRVLVSAPAFKTSDYAEMVGAVRAPGLERTVFMDSPEWAALAAGEGGPGPGAVRDLAPGLDTDDPINLQYTSGTTGFPKGATLTHHNILNNGFFVGEALGYTEADRICIPVPLYHCFGMVMGNLAATSHGAAMVYPEAAFDPAATLAAAAQEACTSIYGVPTMFIAQLDHPAFAEHDLGSLRTGIMAGSPCPVEVMRRVMDRMGIAEMSICFGMTETSPVSTQTPREDTIEHRCETVGTVHPHLEIKVIDPETGRTVERGSPGEFCTRGYSVMRGYWEEPERTAEAVDPAGWMHTGDLATMDHDGYVQIVGRSKDMIIRGGENVYPREIEEFLYGHPDVADVQVISVPDARYGEEVMAWVIPRPGASLEPEEIREYCRGAIAHYKVPRYVKLTTAFPMTVTGKVQKYKMREEAIAELGLADAASVATA
jgi:fatty-acyl-CoA synthase